MISNFIPVRHKNIFLTEYTASIFITYPYLRREKCSSENLLVVYQTISLPRVSKLYYLKANISSFLPNTCTFLGCLREIIKSYWFTESSICWLHDYLNPSDCSKQSATPRFTSYLKNIRITYKITPFDRKNQTENVSVDTKIILNIEKYVTIL
jgi:hypothetical protein